MLAINGGVGLQAHATLIGGAEYQRRPLVLVRPLKLEQAIDGARKDQCARCKAVVVPLSEGSGRARIG
jgi:hypothetical protein